MSRCDPHKALLRALHGLHPGLEVIGAEIEPWASVTFVGTRHVLRCASGPDLSGLADAEFDLRGHLVADLSVEREAGMIVVEALLIESA